ncbi:MAG: aminotransferase class V-fold PLP-dependent enzyme [Acidobacteria bacterium]|nr:MAG: aminotransferase class V-fold PLP-dependent enzyme [Acidobacteriota bacterium]
MVSRRTFVRTVAAPAVLGLLPAALAGEGAARALAELTGAAPDPAESLDRAREVARDESYWRIVQQAYSVDRTLVNFNNGGVSPPPVTVQRAMKRHLDFSNAAPAYNMWRVLEPRREAVRERLARFFGCDPEEVALTRNASEGLQICQFGLDLARGDEVLTTTQDYPRMLNTFRQRERREGIALRQVPVPVPSEDPQAFVRRLEAAVTEKTRAILVCHVINLTGQILPVRAIVEMGRRHGVPVIVDGAHSFAHFPFTRDELGCDYFATSLHKWLCAPIGSGLLYVRRERIPALWPLMAADAKQRDDIRKFEEIGTHPAANTLAVAEALTFHETIGPLRKAERLRYLRDRWARALIDASDRVRLHTSLDPRFSCGIATFSVDGIDSAELGRRLWQEHRILTATIDHPEVQGVRVSPHVYSTLEEVDRFVDAVLSILRST